MVFKKALIRSHIMIARETQSISPYFSLAPTAARIT